MILELTVLADGRVDVLIGTDNDPTGYALRAMVAPWPAVLAVIDPQPDCRVVVRAAGLTLRSRRLCPRNV